MDLLLLYLEPLRRFADFEGRARRREYWLFNLVNTAIILAIGKLHLFRPIDAPAIFVAWWLFFIVWIIPTLAVSTRRLHDTGRSGWWVFMGSVPVVGQLILAIILCQDSVPGVNQYGRYPKD